MWIMCAEVSEPIHGSASGFCLPESATAAAVSPRMCKQYTIRRAKTVTISGIWNRKWRSTRNRKSPALIRLNRIMAETLKGKHLVSGGSLLNPKQMISVKHHLCILQTHLLKKG